MSSKIVTNEFFELFQFQCGLSFLFIPWSAYWAILHFIGLGLQPYFHKDNELDLKWFSYLTYWGYTSLALFTAWDCAAAVYVHIRRQDIVKNGENPQPRTTLVLKDPNLIKLYFKQVFSESRIFLTVIYEHVHVMRKYGNERVNFCLGKKPSQ